jgi:uncharacterized membrane protein YczE
MTKNVGPADRYIRVLLGIAFLVNIIILQPGIFAGIILFVVGGGLVVSAYTGYCPAYGPLKINTCRETCAPGGDQPQHH